MHSKKRVEMTSPRIRGQLPTCVDSNGVPSVELTLKELEKSMEAGLEEIEVFPINFRSVTRSSARSIGTNWGA